MKNKGMTMIELLITISLMVIMVGGGFLTYSQVRQSQDAEMVGLQVGQIMRAARVRSMAGQDDSSWQVRWQPDRVWTENSEGIRGEEYQLPAGYSFGGPAIDLKFSRADGRVDSCQPSCSWEIRKQDSLVYQLRVLFSGAVED